MKKNKPQTHFLQKEQLDTMRFVARAIVHKIEMKCPTCNKDIICDLSDYDLDYDYNDPQNASMECPHCESKMFFRYKDLNDLIQTKTLYLKSKELLEIE